MSSLPRPTAAIEALTLDFGNVDGPGWRLSGLELALVLDGGPPSGTLRIASLHVASPALALGPLQFSCPRLTLAAGQIGCETARVAGVLPWIGQREFAAQFAYSVADGSLVASISDLALAAGRVDARIDMHAGGWQLNVEAADLELPALHELARRLAPDEPWPPAEGRATLVAKVDSSGRADGVVELSGVTYANEPGTLATEALGARIEWSAQRSAAGWRFGLTGGIGSGQAYAEPVFVDFSVHPVELSADGRYLGGETPGLELERIAVAGSGLGRVSGALQATLGERPGIAGAELELADGSLAGLYPSVLQPFLIGLAVDELQVAGQVAGSVRIDAQRLVAFDVRLDGVDAQDQRGRFGLVGLGGEVCWRADSRECASTLLLQSGSLFGLPIGASRLEARLGGLGGRLAQPLRVPVLDGAVRISTLAVEGYGTEQFSLRFDAELEPIGLRSLGTALGWAYRPAGSLAGRLPQLSYENEVLSVAGTLQADVFGGTIEVRNFRVSEPFGRLPRLRADLEFDDLDLELVTDTFEFGSITGRLGGYVHELRLLQWSPIGFDARLATPDDDRSRHRISQRAIENLSSVGGGGSQVAAALSSGFLRLFETFSYDRIGIRCRLENDVCSMSGVEPVNGRYYIVKGRGLPRIDVIGSGHRVSWSTLLRRLQRVIGTDTAVLN